MKFDEISKKVMKFGKDTMTEVQKMNEVRQLNGRVNDEKKKLEKIYMEMGKKLYDLYKEAPLEGFEEEIHAIEERFSMIDLFQDQIRTVKGVALCPCCNMEVSAGERFCSNCGSRMPEVITIEEKDEAEVLEGEVVEAESETAEEAEAPEGEEAAEEAEVTEAEGEEAAKEAEVPEGEEAAEEAEVTEAESEETANAEAEVSEAEGEAAANAETEASEAEK